jgi:hypothetical protein
MLYHDGLHRGVGQESFQFWPLPIPAGANLGYSLHNRQVLALSVHKQAAQLISTSFLCSEEETRA